MIRQAMKAMSDTALGKIQEGDRLYKEGDALTKKTFTRWKPEWVGASLNFENACKSYKAAKATEKLADASKRLAEALSESGAFHNAGMALQQAAACLVELDNLAEAVPTFELACQRFREGESEKAAANALFLCGKALLSKKDMARATEYFDQAIERYQDGEALLHSRDCFDHILKVHIEAENWPKALEVLEHQVNMGLALDAEPISCKAAMSACLIYLATDRYTEALAKENELRAGKIASWNSCTERQYFRRVMSGWECGEQEMFDKAAKDLCLCLTGQLARILKKLVVPEGGIDDGDLEPEPESDEDQEDPDGIC